MENVLLIPSYAYNGDTMTKLEVMQYLCSLTKKQKEFEETQKRSKLRSQRRHSLSQGLNRKTFDFPVMEKPTGFFNRKKELEYRSWLANAPAREARKAQLEAQEDARIAADKQEIQRLNQENDEDYARAKILVEEIKTLFQRQILPPGYRMDNIPGILLFYLFNCRANTLTEAINLYHQELHCQKMEDIAAEQLEMAKRSYQIQEEILASQERTEYMTRESLSKMSYEMEKTRKAAENASFMADMLWLMSL